MIFFNIDDLREYERLVQKMKDDCAKPVTSHWPSDCPYCGGPAYIGIVPAALDCKDKCEGSKSR